MREFVVYTVLTGDHSQLNNPFPEGCGDYKKICFTDDTCINANGWTLVKLEKRYLDPMRESRRPKLLPHLFLPEFEWSLYLDNTVRLSRDPFGIYEKYKYLGSNFFCFYHPNRTCLYEEAEKIIQWGIDDEYIVRKQINYYSGLGYPKKNGLIAGGFLFRRHNANDVIRHAELWYEQVLRFSWRDQLSFNFVAKMLNFKYSELNGKLIENEYMKWPGFPLQLRIPANFNDEEYMSLNPEVKDSGLSPRRHYLLIGAKKGLFYTRK